MCGPLEIASPFTPWLTVWRLLLIVLGSALPLGLDGVSGNRIMYLGREITHKQNFALALHHLWEAVEVAMSCCWSCYSGLLGVGNCSHGFHGEAAVDKALRSPSWGWVCERFVLCLAEQSSLCGESFVQ